MKKVKVYHFHNGSGGGVRSVIRNLLLYSQHDRIENHVIYTINKDELPKFELPNLTGAKSERIFYYSPQWNFYHTCKQLAKLLPDENAVIIAHDWLELGMASNLGLQNTIIQVLHGDYDYYYQLAKKHAATVDAYITVSESIKLNLEKQLPDKIENVHYFNFPVPQSQCNGGVEKLSNSIVFIGRATKEKGYHLLPAIADLMQQKQINVQWHIVGKINPTDKNIWGESINVSFYDSLSNEAVCSLVCKMEYFILPSVAEGMPVSLIECMKAGVVPLVNNLPGGMQELIVNGETGFLIKNNDVISYAEVLEKLITKEPNNKLIGDNCKRKADKLFDPIKNTTAYENLFEQVYDRPKIKKPAIKVYGSRLDHSVIPNAFVTYIRKFKIV